MSDKKKYELEFIVKTSPKLLYPRLSTPSGLAEWFADDVNLKKDLYIFSWGGSEEEARVLTKKNDHYIKFQWVEDEDTDCYFEFRINVDPMTGEVALLVTDYCEEGDQEEATQLWESQIAELKHNLGLV